jgi:hypothetical protein
LERQAEAWPRDREVQKNALGFSALVFPGEAGTRCIIHLMQISSRFRLFSSYFADVAARAGLFLFLVMLAYGQEVRAQATWSPIVTVGPGYVDCYTRQVIRTSGDVVYVVTNASGFSGGTAAASLRVYKGSPAGNPTAFAEVDPGHRPSNAVRMGGVEAKIAGSDRFIQIVYEDIAASQAKYVKFDTVTDTWGTPEIVGPLSGQNTLNRYMGKTGLALDANSVPHVITGGTNEAMYYTNRVSGTWSAPLAIAGSSSHMHPSMSFDHNGTLHVAYYDGNINMFYRSRNPANGTWSAVETVSNNVSTSQSDESPSLVIDSSGRILVNYISGDFTFHYKLARRTAANTWADISPGTAVAGHGPGLYIDSADNIYALEGHDLSIIQPSVDIRSAAGTWGPYQILASGPPTRDGSASARWDLLWPGSATHLDTVNMDENGVDPQGNHYGITYYLHASLGVTPPPPVADFSLTLPAGTALSIKAGQSASTSLTISASSGFNQNVTLSCSGAPAGATCGVSPPSVNPNGASVTAQISITSTARSSAALRNRSPWPWAGLWTSGILINLVLLIWTPQKKRNRLLARASLCVLFAVGIVTCGGGNTSVPTPVGGGGGGGTPAGSYVLTVTGTSGTQTHTTSINLTIQ